MSGATVFLDRDGVINRATIRDGRPYAPATPDDLEILPGVAGAIEQLRSAGYQLVVVTNQPDIARGLTTCAAVDSIHARLAERLGLDDIRVCPHDDGDGCDCRKPKPGLLLRGAFDGPSSVIVGDRWRDIEAGLAAGCGATVLVDYHYDEPMVHEPDVRVGSLAEAAAWILDRARRQTGPDPSP